ncbi:cytochrome c oxidase subunit 3 [Candidatus Kryptobacter tengchongensis]|uniref:cytochrome c oxidase subunit 3 n=1 Tax=Kryptobacter tengchongensis TaxID=1643429 RepID=UPI0007081A33|nr:cytochrome c oxidase subunit 3 [Candidatus Kryptobacter tengchongensis]CUS93675.1 cytochrome c oxidase subunit 3 [Candidatus Kryptobacter tengchongensis]CUU02225.1 cytochrome c oxidase subunit 3 [Candidatus Kryptobacter tengchongensis]
MVAEKKKEAGISNIDSGRIFNNGGGGGAGGHSYSYALPVNPAKFGLWLFISAIIMFFSALTSAYIVRHSAGNWLKFNLPPIFVVNTLILIFSSVTIQMSYFRLKRNKLSEFKLLFLFSTLLGVSFLIGQLIGWEQLKNMGIYVGTNPSSSFFYLLTWAHAIHLIGGVVALVYVLIKALFGHYNSKNRLGVELCITYWHFLDILWIYLFIFINVTI